MEAAREFTEYCTAGGGSAPANACGRHKLNVANKYLISRFHGLGGANFNGLSVEDRHSVGSTCVIKHSTLEINSSPNRLKLRIAYTI